MNPRSGWAQGGFGKILKLFQYITKRSNQQGSNSSPEQECGSKPNIAPEALEDAENQHSNGQ